MCGRENVPMAESGGKWNKGDRTSWEEQIKNRAATQNEYKRIGVVEGPSKKA